MASTDTARPSSRQNQRLSTHAALQLTPLLGMLGQRAFHMKCGVRAIKWALFMRAVHMLRDSYRFEVSTWGRRPLRDSTAAPWADARNAQMQPPHTDAHKYSAAGNSRKFDKNFELCP